MGATKNMKNLENEKEEKKTEEDEAISEKEAIKKAMDLRGYTQTSLAKELGYAHQSGVSSMLRAKSMSVDTFVMTMNKMGFDVVIKKMGFDVVIKDNRKKGEWRLQSGITTVREPTPGAIGKKGTSGRKARKQMPDGDSE